MSDRPLPSAWWFLDEIVKPTFQESIEEKGSLRRVLLSAVVIDHFADYICEHPHMHAYWMPPIKTVDAKFDFKKCRKNLMSCSGDFNTVVEISNAFKHVVRRSGKNGDGKVILKYGIPNVFSFWVEKNITKKGIYDEELKYHRPKFIVTHEVRFRNDLTGEIGNMHDALQKAVIFLEQKLLETEPRPPL